MRCCGPRCIYVLYTSGQTGSRLYVGTFSTMERAIERALIMKWKERTWVEEVALDVTDEEPVTVWEKPPEPMGLPEARRMWGGAMNLDELKEWIEVKNKIDHNSCDPTIPMGATVEIDPKTGKAIPRSDY